MVITDVIPTPPAMKTQPGKFSGALGGVGPWHRFVDAGCGSAVDKLGQHVGDPGERIDRIELAGFQERRISGPVLGDLPSAVASWSHESATAKRQAGRETALDADRLKRKCYSARASIIIVSSMNDPSSSIAKCLLVSADAASCSLRIARMLSRGVRIRAVQTGKSMRSRHARQDARALRSIRRWYSCVREYHPEKADVSAGASSIQNSCLSCCDIQIQHVIITVTRF